MINTTQNDCTYRMTPKRILSYFVGYTLCFVVFFAVVFYPFWSSGTEFIFNGDGSRQHYIALMYYGKWLRSILGNLVFRHRFSVPLWDFSIGYGADVLSSFAYYVIGDPFTLLSGLVPARYTEVLYNVLVVLRIYLAGAAFSAFCLYKRKRYTVILIGSLSYAFCMYAVYGGLKHPFFINPMIYFPIILLGAERIFEKKKPFLFIIMVAVSAMSNFYFFYMIVLGTVLYVIIRFFTLRHEHILKEFGICLLRFLIYGIIGTAISMIIMLPVMLAIRDTLRAQTKDSFRLFYRERYYRVFLKSFFSGSGSGYWTLMGYPWMCAPAIVILFLRDIPGFIRKKKQDVHIRERRGLRVAFVLTTIMLLSPVFGKIFNGFSYVCNRWVWIYSALVAYILVYVWDELFCFIERRKIMYQLAGAAALILVCFHLGWNSYMRYDKSKGNDISIFLKNGQAYQNLQNGLNQEIMELTEKSSGDKHPFWRFEKSSYSMKNETVIGKYNGLQFYWSVSPGVVSQYMQILQLNHRNTFNYSGLMSRVFLEALASVKYYVSETGNVPYGYTRTEYENIYENQLALPLCYTYRSCLDKTLFESLDPTERAEAMLQGVLIDDDESLRRLSSGKAVYEKTTPALGQERLSCSLEAGENTVIKSNNSFKSKKKNGKVRIVFEGKEKCETYILIKNMRLKPAKGKSRVKLKARGNIATNVFFRRNGPKVTLTKDVMINLGYSEKPQRSAEIEVEYKGKYSFDDIMIICQPMDRYAQYIDDLKKYSLDEKIDTNMVSGNIHLDEPRILCFSIPWSRGWTAKVDGKKARLLKANVMYTALALPEGDHQIELYYCTPGLKAGMGISLAGMIALGGLFIKYRKRDPGVYGSSN